MKYQVKLRKVVVQETIIEVDNDGSVIAAMGLAEAIMSDPVFPMPSTTTTTGKWVAVSVTSK